MIEDKRSDVLDALAVGMDLEITAGIHASEGSLEHNGPTNAELGAIHEFGTSEIPQRSFIRAWFDENRAQVEVWAAEAADAVLAGADPIAEADRVALLMESGIKERILSGIGPPLAENTKRGKEGGVPLIDTSQMLGSILGKASRK